MVPAGTNPNQRAKTWSNADSARLRALKLNHSRLISFLPLKVSLPKPPPCCRAGGTGASPGGSGTEVRVAVPGGPQPLCFLVPCLDSGSSFALGSSYVRSVTAKLPRRSESLLERVSVGLQLPRVN